MKKILVPTDFSPNADKALDFAVQIAKKAKAKIILIHACDLLEMSFKDNLLLKKEYNKKITREAREKLSLRRESIRNTEKLIIQIKLYEGLVTETILHASRLIKPDMIIMGTLGNAGIRERIFGSKTSGIMTRTTIPVLAIPLLSEWTPPSKILLSLTTFSEGKQTLIQPVIELATLFNATLTVFKFSEFPTIPLYKYKAVERAGKSYVKKLQSLSPALRSDFVHVDGYSFEKSIDRYIKRNKINMIAMITHKRSFLNSLFNRSKTKKMSYRVSIPLLALPAQARK
jgi:nucleotide-binding universal stress UspA family protein